MSRDYRQAAQWFTKAAAQGHARGRYWLGVCLEKGQGLKKDLKRAEELYRQAAGQGIREAGEALERLDKERKNPLKKLFGFGK